LIRCSTKASGESTPPLVFGSLGIQATCLRSRYNFSLCLASDGDHMGRRVSAGHPCMTIFPAARKPQECSVVRLRTRPKHPPPPDLPIRGNFQGHGRGLHPATSARSGTVDRGQSFKFTIRQSASTKASRMSAPTGRQSAGPFISVPGRPHLPASRNSLLCDTRVRCGRRSSQPCRMRSPSAFGPSRRRPPRTLSTLNSRPTFMQPTQAALDTIACVSPGPGPRVGREPDPVRMSKRARERRRV